MSNTNEQNNDRGSDGAESQRSVLRFLDELQEAAERENSIFLEEIDRIQKMTGETLRNLNSLEPRALPSQFIALIESLKHRKDLVDAGSTASSLKLSDLLRHNIPESLFFLTSPIFLPPILRLRYMDMAGKKPNDKWDELSQKFGLLAENSRFPVGPDRVSLNETVPHILRNIRFSNPVSLAEMLDSGELTIENCRTSDKREEKALWFLDTLLKQRNFFVAEALDLAELQKNYDTQVAKAVAYFLAVSDEKLGNKPLLATKFEKAAVSYIALLKETLAKAFGNSGIRGIVPAFDKDMPTLKKFVESFATLCESSCDISKLERADKPGLRTAFPTILGDIIAKNRAEGVSASELGKDLQRVLISNLESLGDPKASQVGISQASSFLYALRSSITKGESGRPPVTGSVESLSAACGMYNKYFLEVVGFAQRSEGIIVPKCITDLIEQVKAAGNVSDSLASRLEELSTGLDTALYTLDVLVEMTRFETFKYKPGKNGKLVRTSTPTDLGRLFGLEGTTTEVKSNPRKK